MSKIQLKHDHIRFAPTKICMGIQRRKTALTVQDVEEIYRHKIRLSIPDTFKSSLIGVESSTKGQSCHVAKRFGVSPKTIRDIWSKKTWAATTAHLWSEKGIKLTAQVYAQIVCRVCVWWCEYA